MPLAFPNKFPKLRVSVITQEKEEYYYVNGASVQADKQPPCLEAVSVVEKKSLV